MKRKRKYKVIVAWLLLLTLMPFFTVKAIHFHHSEEEASACHSGETHPHTSDDCAICHFMLSPFTQAESFQIHIFLSVFNYQPVYAADRDCLTILYPYRLRAPPAAPFHDLRAV
ncbi:MULTISPECIES: hypothetical protein [Bacteroides]|uniref:DUF2946 domain-containing protein n=2 Tax=Prevotella heparinolytica TaxID=28113 RepID=A0A3P2AB44_9BACE|nr:hypothetical protein [Bacteroides heparinolyticus]MCI6213304.1 hypothetical protein [Bacteroides heparinolyticus]RRD92621.1 hypothetical protein EII33_03195 [Bacteroides heparinolyticus]VFB14564.1 Uncharacterised protein [Bacteroides heparinolyticus]